MPKDRSPELVANQTEGPVRKNKFEGRKIKLLRPNGLNLSVNRRLEGVISEIRSDFSSEYDFADKEYYDYLFDLDPSKIPPELKEPGRYLFLDFIDNDKNIIGVVRYDNKEKKLVFSAGSAYLDKLKKEDRIILFKK